MLENNQGYNLNDQYDDVDDTRSSLSNNDELNDEQDNPVSQSSANEQDNDKEQPNLAADVADKNRNIATSFHDNTRTTGRANEADDRLDTGSGGLSAGGVKSATDL
jgi:hypothetical protein